MNGPHEGSRLQPTKWTDPTRVKLTQVLNMDGPNEGSRLQSTKWTDPTRVKNLHKSTKWTDPMKGQIYTSPQRGQTQRRVKTPVHKVDGSHKG